MILNYRLYQETSFKNFFLKDNKKARFQYTVTKNTIAVFFGKFVFAYVF